MIWNENWNAASHDQIMKPSHNYISLQFARAIGSIRNIKQFRKASGLKSWQNFVKQTCSRHRLDSQTWQQRVRAALAFDCLQANCAGVCSSRSAVVAAAAIGAYSQICRGRKWRSAGGGKLAKMKTVDTPAECHRLLHASCQKWIYSRSDATDRSQRRIESIGIEARVESHKLELGMPWNSSHIRCQLLKLTQLFTQLACSWAQLKAKSKTVSAWSWFRVIMIPIFDYLSACLRSSHLRIWESARSPKDRKTNAWGIQFYSVYSQIRSAVGICRLLFRIVSQLPNI